MLVTCFHYSDPPDAVLVIECCQAFHAWCRLPGGSLYGEESLTYSFSSKFCFKKLLCYIFLTKFENRGNIARKMGESIKSGSKYWSEHKGYGPNWFTFFAGYIKECITGNPDLAPTPWAYQTFVGKKPVENMLEIGCLEGTKLVGMYEAGFTRAGVGVDVAAGAIERGQRKHSHLSGQIELRVMDLNEPVLPQNTFDVVLANGVLHHIEQLESCLSNLYGCLKVGGYLFASEFTGPSRYRYSEQSIELINRGRELLPNELRSATPFSPSKLAGKLAADPSESIRSEELIDLVPKFFDRVIIRPYGGNILARALDQTFFENFNPERSEHQSAVDRLIRYERGVLENGDPTHHAYFIAQRTQGH